MCELQDVSTDWLYPHHVAEVLHLRDQIQLGLNVAEGFMMKRLMMVCADKNKGNTLSGLMRRVLQETSNKFDAADISKVHHLGFVDMTKFGRLSALEINDVCTWCHQLLTQNPDFSTLVLFTCTCVHYATLISCSVFRLDHLSRYGLHVLPCHCRRWSVEWFARRVKAGVAVFRIWET